MSQSARSVVGLLGLCLLATLVNGVRSFEPSMAEASSGPALEAPYNGDTIRIRGISAILSAPDSTVKVGTVVLNLTGMLPGDTLHYWYSATNATGTADTVIKHSRHLKVRDSLLTPAPAYSKTRYFEGCLEIESGGRASGVRWPKGGPICWLWPYTRDERVEPGFGIERLVVMPLPPMLHPDTLPTLACAAWQTDHPGKSVWLSSAEVNRKAVPACMRGDSTNGQLVVWQYCAFAQDTAGQKLLTVPSATVDYCLELFREWQAERDV